MKRSISSRQQPRAGSPFSVPVRTDRGRIVGMLDPCTLQLEIRRGAETERVDLRGVLREATAQH